MYSSIVQALVAMPVSDLPLAFYYFGKFWLNHIVTIIQLSPPIEWLDAWFSQIEKLNNREGLSWPANQILFLL